MQVELGLGEARELLEESGRHRRRSYAGGGPLPRERLWIRAAALGIDLVLLAGGPLVLTTVIVFSVLLATPDPPPWLPFLYRAAQAVFAVLFLARDRLLSPGKKLLGLGVMGSSGQPATLVQSLVRNLPLLVPGWNLWEGFAVLGRPDGCRPGDRLARTSVVELA
jgi:uncharacterized RDD family membrane protein YckC